ncbi:MAG: hypothetical protein GY841_00725 [FCB group bacterium]|nr:hypothetical protein [FCB group bacterium]
MKDQKKNESRIRELELQLENAQLRIDLLELKLSIQQNAVPIEFYRYSYPIVPLGEVTCSGGTVVSG